MSHRENLKRARLSQRKVRKPVHRLRSSEVLIAGTALQNTAPRLPHITRWQLASVIAAVLVAHIAIVWYARGTGERVIEPRKVELNIEIVRPKPLEPPKVEPPKPEPPRPRPQAQVLPKIQQSDPVPSTVGESTEPPVAVAPIVSEPPPTPPPAPESVTEPIGRAGYLNNPAPDYPAVAVRQGWQGTVLLRVHVLANGSVESVEVMQSSGKRLLDEEAIRTVKGWSFTPSKRGATPIDGWATVPIEFLLDP